MKKIMFNDKFLLTQAVLEGRKTQTRRIIPKDFFSLTWDKRDDTLVYENSMGDFIDIRNSKYALCKAGETVAVAQSYKDLGYKKKQYTRKEDSENGYLYSEFVNEIPMPWPINGFSNKLFVKPELMPHQIRITNVRVERLQDISDEDCLKEGIEEFSTHSTANGKAYTFHGVNESYKTPREAYASLIDKVSRKGTWESNPYVFVYDFESVK